MNNRMYEPVPAQVPNLLLLRLLPQPIDIPKPGKLKRDLRVDIYEIPVPRFASPEQQNYLHQTS